MPYSGHGGEPSPDDGGGMLTAVGATPVADRVYRHLVTVASATEAEIGARIGEAPAAALAELCRRGFATRLDGEPARYAATAPHVVDALLNDRLREVRAAQTTLDAIEAVYREQRRARGTEDPIEVVTGRAALRDHSLQVERLARQELRVLVKPPFVSLAPDEHAEAITHDEDLLIRAVYDAELLAIPGWLDAMRRNSRVRDECRAYPDLPLKMYIADHTAALLPLTRGQDTTPAAAIVHPSGLLDALVTLFDHIWSAATPLIVQPDGTATPSASPLTADDHHLLSLLLAGLTDETIAGHLGVSVRTVQRRVAGLMSATHTRSRMQLAWQAARRGWV